MVAGVAVPGLEVEAVAAPGMEVKELAVEVAAPVMEVLVEVVAVEAVMMAANGADIKLTKTKAVEKWSFVKSW